MELTYVEGVHLQLQQVGHDLPIGVRRRTMGCGSRDFAEANDGARSMRCASAIGQFDMKLDVGAFVIAEVGWPGSIEALVTP